MAEGMDATESNAISNRQIVYLKKLWPWQYF